MNLLLPSLKMTGARERGIAMSPHRSDEQYITVVVYNECQLNLSWLTQLANITLDRPTGEIDSNATCEYDQLLDVAVNNEKDWGLRRPPPLSINYSSTTMIAVSLALLLMVVTTAFGNFLVGLALFRYRSLRTVSNFLIGNLALSDFLLATTILPLSTVNECLGRWVFGRAMCNLWLSLDVLYCTASIWNLCMIAFDRYTATLYPLWYREKRSAKQAALYVILVWGISLAICVPPVLGWGEPTQNFVYNNGTEVYQCVLYQSPGYVLYSASGSFYIPFLVTSFMYVRIFAMLRLRTHRMRRAREISRSAAIRSRRCGLADLPAITPSGLAALENRRLAKRTDHYVELHPLDGVEKRTQSSLLQDVLDEAVWIKSSSTKKPELAEFQSAVDLGFTNNQHNMAVVPIESDMGVSEYVTVPMNGLIETIQTLDNSSDNEFIVEPVRYDVELLSNDLVEPLRSCLTLRANELAKPSCSCLRLTSTDLTKPILSCAHAVNSSDSVATANKSDTLETHTDVYQRDASIETSVETRSDDIQTASLGRNRLNGNHIVLGGSFHDSCPEVCADSSTTLVCNARMELTSISTIENHLALPVPKHPPARSLVYSRSKRPSSTTAFHCPITALGRDAIVSSSVRSVGFEARLHGRFDQRELRATVRMAIIISLFCVMWVGFFVVYVVRGWCPLACSVPRELEAFFFWLGYSNSSVNPILYTLFNEDFRKAFHKILCIGADNRRMSGLKRRTL